jgi:hypothetical protein
VPEVYAAEPITGLLYTFPFVIFAGLPFFAPSFRKGFLSALNARERNHWNLTTLSVGGSFLITFGLLMLFFWVGMRYTGDFMPSLMILSITGFWQGYQSLNSKILARKLYIAFGAILASISIVLSVLLAISANHEIIDLVIHLLPSP